MVGVAFGLANLTQIAPFARSRGSNSPTDPAVVVDLRRSTTGRGLRCRSTGEVRQSRRPAAVMVKQPTQPALASDRARFGLNVLWRRVVACARRPVAQPLMRPELVVIEDVGLHDVVKLPQAEAKEEVQALAFEASDP